MKKKLFASLVMLSLVLTLGFGTVGCGKKEGSKPAGDDTYSLDLPTGTKIKQGESKDVTVGIKRGKKYEEDVTLKVEPPTGLTADPATVTIKKGSNDGKVTIKAADDAAAKEHAVKVSGSPKDLSGEFKVTVEKK